MQEYASAGIKKRKRRVTLCLHCQEQGRHTLADFVHLNMHPCTDLGPIGLCWFCYNDFAHKLLSTFASIMQHKAELDAFYAALPEGAR